MDTAGEPAADAHAADEHTARRAHWDGVYGRLAPTDVSWYQAEPGTSLELLDAIGMPASAGLVDVGGGASTLAGALVDRGFDDVTVLDISARALREARARLGGAGDDVRWIEADALTWSPPRQYDVWHDRAVFHFLLTDHDRARYLATLGSALRPGGHVIVGTFALDGPDHCSGLPTARYDVPSLEAVFGDRFVLVESRRHEHLTPSGAIQPFTWVALRRVA